MSNSFGQDMAQARREREQLDPADFVFCCEYYVGPDEHIADAFSWGQQWPDDCDLTTDQLGKCDHCGTHHFYGAIFKDRRDGSFLQIGNACAGKFFHFDSRKSYLVAQAEKAKAQASRAAAAKAQAAAFLAARPEIAAMLQTNHRIIRDIAAKLEQYGSISERQIELVRKLAAEAQANPEPEPVAIPAELLNGRHTLTGTVLGIRVVESEFGPQTKIVFRDDRGFKVYGTYPTTEESYDRGARISFDARIVKSKDDPCFGFFSRPTRGEVIG